MATAGRQETAVGRLEPFQVMTTTGPEVLWEAGSAPEIEVLTGRGSPVLGLQVAVPWSWLTSNANTSKLPELGVQVVHSSCPLRAEPHFDGKAQHSDGFPWWQRCCYAVVRCWGGSREAAGIWQGDADSGGNCAREYIVQCETSTGIA